MFLALRGMFLDLPLLRDQEKLEYNIFVSVISCTGYLNKRVFFSFGSDE
jgi:hypothetical protein